MEGFAPSTSFGYDVSKRYDTRGMRNRPSHFSPSSLASGRR